MNKFSLSIFVIYRVRLLHSDYNNRILMKKQQPNNSNIIRNITELLKFCDKVRVEENIQNYTVHNIHASEFKTV